MSQVFKHTAKQAEAVQVLKSDARHILLVGGSRSGKSFILMRSMIVRASLKAGTRHVCFRFRYNHIKSSLWAITFPDVMKLCFPDVPYTLNQTDLIAKLSNGSEIWFAGLDDKARTEKILGTEFSTIWFNEVSQIPYESITIALTRLSENSELKKKAYYDCNPPSVRHWAYKVFVEKKEPEKNVPLQNPEHYQYLFMNPRDNEENLPPGYIEYTLGGLNSRARLRFLDGKFQSDESGALWDESMINMHRVVTAPAMVRKVLAIDPTATVTGDEVGMIGAGLGVDGRLYVFSDDSGNYTPSGWGQRAADRTKTNGFDCVVAETNQGGDMVEFVLRQFDKLTRIIRVHAKVGKVLRADPVISMYERGMVSHVGEFEALENEMCTWDPQDSASPNRIDALVYALLELTQQTNKATGARRKATRGKI